MSKFNKLYPYYIFLLKGTIRHSIHDKNDFTKLMYNYIIYNICIICIKQFFKLCYILPIYNYLQLILLIPG